MDAAASPSDVPAVRRAAILRAAGQLFAERGFRAVGMAEIGESAGMSAASLYRFFSGKGAILAVLWDEALSEVTEAAAAAADSAASADERLELILRAHASLLVRKYAHVGNLVRRGTAGLPKADRGYGPTNCTSCCPLATGRSSPASSPVLRFCIRSRSATRNTRRMCSSKNLCA
jgi:AcrR family transcriptional regulator